MKVGGNWMVWDDKYEEHLLAIIIKKIFDY